MAAAVRSPLPLDCSFSSSAGPALGSAPRASVRGVGGAKPSELWVAMSVVPVYRPSSLLHRAAVAASGEEEGLGGLLATRGQRGRWSTAIQPRWSASGGRVRRKRGSTNNYANYGIKEHGTPFPAFDASPQVKTSPYWSLMVDPSSGQGEVPKFRDHGTSQSWRAYASPKSYGAPKNYGIRAYSAQSPARAVAVEAIEPPPPVVEEVIIAEPREQEPELGGGDDGPGRDGGRGGGGGGGDGSGEGEEDEPQKPLSTAQKLTLVYAALVGAGGLIGFVKSGSNKSLTSGGGAALALFIVFTQLPAHPTYASSFGFVISAALLGIMYPRFKKSGKFMPAGLVALVSLIMTGGYLHGIVRTAH